MLAFWKSGSAGKKDWGQNKRGSAPFLQVFTEPPLSPWTNMTSTMGSGASWRRRSPSGSFLGASSYWAVSGCGDLFRVHRVVRARLSPDDELSTIEPSPILEIDSQSGSRSRAGKVWLGARAGPAALIATALWLSSCNRTGSFRDPGALSGDDLRLGEDSSMASGSTIQSQQ